MTGAVLVALLAGFAPLFARLSESLWGLAPCELCLWQRLPYWAALTLALAAIALPRQRRPLLLLAGLAAAVSAAIAAFHLGVEWKWWPSPLPGCQAPRVDPNLSLDDMMATLRPMPTKPCDEPALLLPGLPLSMAGMNLIYGMGLAALAFRFARKEPR